MEKENDPAYKENEGFIDSEHCLFTGACPHGNFYTCNNCSGSQTIFTNMTPTPMKEESTAELLGKIGGIEV